MVKVYDWNMADDIKTKEDVLAFLEAAVEENDPKFLLKVIGSVIRSEGMAQIVNELAEQRENRYLSEVSADEPLLTAAAKVFDILGFQFSIRHKKAL